MKGIVLVGSAGMRLHTKYYENKYGGTHKKKKKFPLSSHAITRAGMWQKPYNPL